jgi:hypothetical protein
VIVALCASSRMMATLPAFRHRKGDLFDWVAGAIVYVVIAVFFGIPVWLGIGALVEAWRKPPPLREMLWLPVFVAMAVVFGLATVAWVIGPFAPSFSGYVWSSHLR